jgi:hypothetical protein
MINTEESQITRDQLMEAQKVLTTFVRNAKLQEGVEIEIKIDFDGSCKVWFRDYENTRNYEWFEYPEQVPDHLLSLVNNQEEYISLHSINTQNELK